MSDFTQLPLPLHTENADSLGGMLLDNAPYGMFGYKVMIYGIGLAVACAIAIVYSL
jgi:hypothetical protein